MMHAALDPVDFVEDRRKRLPAMMLARSDVEHCRRRDRRGDRTPRKEAIAVALDAQRAAVVYPECSQPFLRGPRRSSDPNSTWNWCAMTGATLRYAVTPANDKRLRKSIGR